MPDQKHSSVPAERQEQSFLFKQMAVTEYLFIPLYTQPI